LEAEWNMEVGLEWFRKDPETLGRQRTIIVQYECVLGFYAYMFFMFVLYPSSFSSLPRHMTFSDDFHRDLRCRFGCDFDHRKYLAGCFWFWFLTLVWCDVGCDFRIEVLRRGLWCPMSCLHVFDHDFRYLFGNGIKHKFRIPFRYHFN